MIFSSDSLGYEIDAATGTQRMKRGRERVLVCLKGRGFCVMAVADRHCLMFMSETDVPH